MMNKTYMEKEIWKAIQGFEGLYEVSSLGRVKSLERKVHRRDNVFIIIKERILKLGLNKKGYWRVDLCKDCFGKDFKIHRLVAIAFISNPDNKPQINHIDGIKTNNNVGNLEWVTNSENNLHACKMGLQNNQGENNGRSKFKNADILKIRELYKTGEYSHRKLGAMFNCNHKNICDIVNRETWNHI